VRFPSLSFVDSFTPVFLFGLPIFYTFYYNFLEINKSEPMKTAKPNIFVSFIIYARNPTTPAESTLVTTAPVWPPFRRRKPFFSWLGNRNDWCVASAKTSGCVNPVGVLWRRTDITALLPITACPTAARQRHFRPSRHCLYI
jgi:hypothetical protein